MDNIGAIPYIKSQIRFACKTFKNRIAGSAAERRCQMHFKNELEQWSDDVVSEDFTLSPGAFLGWIIPATLLNLFALGCLWAGSLGVWAAAIGAVCAAISLALLLFEFVLYRRFVDFAFPKATSVNVFAKRKPAGKTKRRIIFGGHADATYEMPFITNSNNRSVYFIIGANIIGMIYLFVANLLRLLKITAAGPIPALIGTAFVPFFIAMFFFVNKSCIVDGANDNLSGCLVAMGVLREMQRYGVRLNNTEVCCLITGAEESGLRGAMAFSKANKQQFQDVETIFIALDTLHDADQLMVYTRGINGTQKNSQYVAELLQSAGAARGLALPEAGNYPGAMDSEAFSREGLLACGLGGVDHDPKPYYHTRADNADNIGESCIASALDICIQAAIAYDQQAAANAGEPLAKAV